jgi:hypothetical protein
MQWFSTKPLVAGLGVAQTPGWVSVSKLMGWGLVV